MSTGDEDVVPHEIPAGAREVAAEIVALFLAQSDTPEAPHLELGFTTQRDAFETVAKLFGTNKHTVKLTRDAFDYHTGSGRVGWKEPLRPTLARILEAYSGYSRSELRQLCDALIGEKRLVHVDEELIDAAELFARVEADSNNTKTNFQAANSVVEFSNTGRRSDGWFVLTVGQIVECLKNMLEHLEEFQALNHPDRGYDEGPWRRIFQKRLSNRIAKTMGNTQTLPTFELLAKIIHFSSTDEPRKYKTIQTDPAMIELALATLLPADLHRKAFASDGPRKTGGDNELFYGAPGTGKSHNVWQAIDKANDPHFVTVFHPDMQNSDFTGTLKPGVDANGNVTYAFRPGPFARAVASAWANPDKKVYLVIEELNRAVAPAVFGELFQLLDRDRDGSSTYGVDFPSPEFADWFGAETGQSRERLSLPSNLWIVATMNSADQGVYPLDTAFRRRWRQTYLAIDYEIAPANDIAVAGASGTLDTNWKALVEALNRFLVEKFEIGEDRLIGPRFVDEYDLDDGVLPGKLLIYLWDDLLRHHQDKELFHPGIRTYGDLDRRLKDGDQVFSDAFIGTLGSAQNGSDEEQTGS